MARQTGMSTPIFDELLREMTEGLHPPPAQPAPPVPAAPADPDPTRTAPPAPRRRYRAD
jgi:hypothetical protein